jgi:hypothetical protein
MADQPTLGYVWLGDAIAPAAAEQGVVHVILACEPNEADFATDPGTSRRASRGRLLLVPTA